MTESVNTATKDQLNRAQGKITYLGSQSKPISSLVFYSKNFKPTLDRFVEFQNKREAYANDNLPVQRRFSVTPTEFHRMLQAVKHFTSKVEAAKPPDFLSFAVAIENDSRTFGQEFRIEMADGRKFYEKLIDSLDQNDKLGRDELIAQCNDIYPPE